MSTNKNVLIIAGATKGLGKALAQSAYKNNYPVALIARNSEELAKMHDMLKSNNSPNISIHSADLTNMDETQNAFNKIVHKHKKICGLVNCAGTWTGGKTVKQLSSSDMHASLMQNFFSAFHAIKALLNLSLDTLNQSLSIINVGATASLRGSKNCSAFAVAKGALRQLSQSLARELWPENIHVAHLIIDGLIGNTRTKSLNTDIDDNRFIDMQSIAESILQVIEQSRDCWTFEWDIRPFNESW